MLLHTRPASVKAPELAAARLSQPWRTLSDSRLVATSRTATRPGLRAGACCFFHSARRPLRTPRPSRARLQRQLRPRRRRRIRDRSPPQAGL